MHHNPFMERQNGSDLEHDLIARALEGGSEELESLILRHQA